MAITKIAKFRQDLVAREYQHLKDKPGLLQADIVRILMDKYPKTFDNAEGTRESVKCFLKKHGLLINRVIVKKESAVHVTRTEPKVVPVRKNRTTEYSIKDIPKTQIYSIGDLPPSRADPYIPYKVDIAVFNNILDISDVHVPLHDIYALDCAITYGIKNNCTSCIINGDFGDYTHLSVFDKPPTIPDFTIQLDQQLQIIKLLRRLFKNILLVWGNHEERFERFLMKHPEMYAVLNGYLEQKLELQPNEFVKDRRIVEIGKLYSIHGHELQNRLGSSSVNFARTLYMRTGESFIAGDAHQVAEFTFTKMGSGDIISCYAQGHLAEKNPWYRRLNQWQQGFAHIIIEPDGFYHVFNKKIINGKIYP